MSVIELIKMPLIGFMAAFVFSVGVIPLVRKMCLKEGYYDLPGERKIHKKPVPRLGGIAIWLGVVFSLITVVLLQGSYPFGNSISAILVGGTIMFLLGVVDDTYGLSAKFKLIVQLGAALIAFLLGVQINYANIPFTSHLLSFGWLSLPITILWITGLSNAFNFIDGVDGLAGTLGTVSAITLGVIALVVQPPQDTCTLLSFILAGSVMGFLVFNYNPARIFMGDSGSLFMGFLLATLSVVGVMKSVAVTIFLPVFILVVPIFDICFATFRRLLKGKSPFSADAEHLHHKLLQAGLSHNKTVLTLVLATIAFGLIATYIAGALSLYLVAILFVSAALMLLSLLSKLRK
ncbi:MAG: undecaprenyl/decaprenyl-phosphate alpha-N-acetylglucosaminyl 1-phosphate transferase [Candidatus Gastranaerophilales bacterium]|nr:undecaprenyl/decaprenyl-phosphate alpha-N-acetylglucosaminyl 1-phosphate transferase [Candidatus Gastranaerophilales bacterium]